MHSKILNPMNLRFLALGTVTLLLCSCATTSVKKTWKSPQYTAGPITNVAVLVIDERPLLRQAFENRFVEQLMKAGMSASATFKTISLGDINQDKKAAAERLRSAGCQAVLTLRLADIASSYRESRPSGERYAEVITGFEMDMWYDYYSVAYADLSPTYGNLKQQVCLETILFDLGTGKRVWSGLSQSVLKERTDRLAEMDPIVAKFVQAMRRDGMIP